MDAERGLDTLLELDGWLVFDDDGYSTQVKVSRCEVSDATPHGIKYSLTLHDPSNQRILGFDNAHAVQPKRKNRRFTGRRVEFDHKHVDENDPGTPYEFESPDQLIQDFFEAVDEMLSRIKQ